MRSFKAIAEGDQIQLLDKLPKGRKFQVLITLIKEITGDEDAKPLSSKNNNTDVVSKQ